MRAVKSPASPKITMTQGSPCLPMRGCVAAAVGCSANSAIEKLPRNHVTRCPYPLRASVSLRSLRFPQRTQRLKALDLGALLSLDRALFDVSTKFLPHCGKHLLRKRMLLPRAETHEQRRGQHIRWHRFVDRCLDRPAAFARILHESFIFG